MKSNPAYLIHHTKKKFDFSSMNKVILKIKDPSQIDRMFALIREVVLEN